MPTKQGLKCYFGCVIDGPLHHFPKPVWPYMDRFISWKSVLSQDIQEKGENYLIHQVRLCHRHFEPYYCLPSKLLTRNAIPTLNLGSPLSRPQIIDKPSIIPKIIGVPLTSETSQDLPQNVMVPASKFKSSVTTKTCGAAVTNKQAGTAGPALFEDSAKPADIVNAADIINSTHITNTADITNTPDITDSTDIQDGDINDGDTQEETDEQLFSWQRDSEINCDHFDINPDNAIATVQNSALIQTEYGDTVRESSLEETRSETEDKSSNKDGEKDLHEGYKCDMCSGPIYRFRYSCVECANYDLCGACEARAAHPQHYLLRVPRPRPHGEIKLIMDTIRRFLTADLKSLRAEANFVNTLMDEIKSEVLSEAGSDPVPDEPDYPIQLNDSTEEHEDCEMESKATHPSAKKIDVIQDITWLDKDILEEYEIPPENSDVIETKDSNEDNDRCTDIKAKLKAESAHIQHKPEKRKMNEIDS